MRAPHQERAYLHALAEHAEIDARGIEPPVAHRVQVNGLSLRYLDWGRPGARAVVLLHGGGQSAHTWDACCLMLSRQFRCIALDQRGHGDSDWSSSGAYAIDDHASDIAGVVDTLALRDPLMVGMSMGGINAIAYAVRHADRLAGLVSVDVGPDVQFEPVQRLMQGLDAYRCFSSPDDAVERLAGLGARRARSLLRDTLLRNLRQVNGCMWTWKYDPRTVVGLSAEDVLAPRRPLWRVLDRISCPVLVVRGADSEIFSPRDAEEFTRRLPRAACVTVPKARHSVQTDNPRGLTEAIIGFERTVRPPEKW